LLTYSKGIFLSINFEFNVDKSAANKLKHGIDFEDAQRLWDDPKLISVSAKDVNEPRFAIVAMLHEQLWFAVYTVRSSSIRIITVRRARNYEKERYYRQND
jgi:uncharacterized DUF497 family protein